MKIPISSIKVGIILIALLSHFLLLFQVYDASQYHGQDGLGAYGYGYKTPESSKVENRQRSGDVAGSYTYKAPGYGGNDVKVIVGNIYIISIPNMKSLCKYCKLPTT